MSYGHIIQPGKLFGLQWWGAGSDRMEVVEVSRRGVLQPPPDPFWPSHLDSIRIHVYYQSPPPLHHSCVVGRRLIRALTRFNWKKNLVLWICFWQTRGLATSHPIPVRRAPGADSGTRLLSMKWFPR